MSNEFSTHNYDFVVTSMCVQLINTHKQYLSDLFAPFSLETLLRWWNPLHGSEKGEIQIMCFWCACKEQGCETAIFWYINMIEIPTLVHVSRIVPLFYWSPVKTYFNFFSCAVWGIIHVCSTNYVLQVTIRV